MAIAAEAAARMHGTSEGGGGDGGSCEGGGGESGGGAGGGESGSGVGVCKGWRQRGEEGKGGVGSILVRLLRSSSRTVPSCPRFKRGSRAAEATREGLSAPT